MIYIEFTEDEDLYIHFNKDKKVAFVTNSSKEYNYNDLVCRFDFYIQETKDDFLKKWYDRFGDKG